MLCNVIKPKDGVQKEYIFAFFSGFGADASFWDNILPYFSNYECALLSENYFCEPEEQDEDFLRKVFHKKKIIGVGHSLGYAKLCSLHKKYDFFNLEKIIAIEGFSEFLGNIELMRLIRKLSLDYMKICYAINPITTLVVFQTMCGEFMPKVPKKINQELLISDLGLLEEKSISIDIPHLVLSSLDDPIIPFYIIEDNFRKYAEIIYTNFSSHLLGMRFPEYVYKEIMKFVDAYIIPVAKVEESFRSCKKAGKDGDLAG